MLVTVYGVLRLCAGLLFWAMKCARGTLSRCLRLRELNDSLILGSRPYRPDAPRPYISGHFVPYNQISAQASPVPLPTDLNGPKS
jgi:hypothetical protein